MPLMDDTLQPGRVTAKAYFAMAECGILAPDDRVELLAGLIVAMSPHSPGHDATIDRINRALQRALGPEVLIRIQSSFPVSDSSVPEPDISVVPGAPEDYFEAHPTRAHLIVEVAHSSVPQDRLTKAPIYARAGVPTYWLVNLRDRCVEVFRDPEDGKYRSVERLTGSQLCSIDELPSARLTAEDLLPPRGVVVAEV